VAWDSIKVADDIIMSSEYNSSVTDQKTRAIRTEGAGAPGTTPSNAGDIYIDTTAKKSYIAVGTSSSADWRKQVISS